MKRLLLGTFALAFATVACENSSTGPAVMTPPEAPAFGFGTEPSNPPPPPIDSGSVGTATDGTVTFMQVNFSVSYMLNKPENSGWLKFNRDGDTSTDITNSAAIRMVDGVYSGKGIIQVLKDGNSLFIDLSQVSFDGTSFDSCPAPGTDERGTCFTIRMSGPGITFTSERTGKISPTFIIGPDKPTSCSLTTGDACYITP